MGHNEAKKLCPLLFSSVYKNLRMFLGVIFYKKIPAPNESGAGCFLFHMRRHKRRRGYECHEHYEHSSGIAGFFHDEQDETSNFVHDTPPGNQRT
jgi:hypothetical protein